MIVSVISVIFLVLYYYVQYRNWKNQQSILTWPIEINQCPDYWISEGNGICRNKFNLGTCPSDSNNKLKSNGIVNFRNIVGGVSANSNNEQKFNSEMNSKANLIKKCKWTKQCGSSWEGVDKLCT